MCRGSAMFRGGLGQCIGAGLCVGAGLYVGCVCV